MAILGVGNVALDCARLLISAPDRLESTDIAERGLSQLRNSSVEEVHLIARRSHSEVKASALCANTQTYVAINDTRPCYNRCFSCQALLYTHWIDLCFGVTESSAFKLCDT